MNIKILFFLMGTVFICSCSVKDKEIPGVYIAVGLQNNIDTLRILKDGTYIKDVYRKADNSLIYHNTGKWDYKEGRIILQDFFQDEDKPYGKNVTDFKDILITSSFTVGKESGKPAIEYIEEKGKYRYQKLN